MDGTSLLYGQENDGDLIVRYCGGDAEALAVLVDRYRQLVFGVILNITEGRDDAEEIFQEVWLRVIRNAGSYREKNFRAWLLRIAHNLVIDRRRKKKPDVSLDEQSESGSPLSGTIPDRNPDPSREAELGEVNRQIADAVATLPVEQKEVFLMRVRANLSFKEIAKIQKVSINTALARMRYAVAKLQAVLSKTESCAT